MSEMKAYCETLVGETERKRIFQKLRPRIYEISMGVNETAYEDSDGILVPRCTVQWPVS